MLSSTLNPENTLLMLMQFEFHEIWYLLKHWFTRKTTGSVKNSRSGQFLTYTSNRAAIKEKRVQMLVGQYKHAEMGSSYDRITIVMIQEIVEARKVLTFQ